MGFLGGGTRPPTIPEETPEAMSDDFDTGGGGGGALSDGGDGGSSKKGFSKDRLAFLGGGGTNKGGLTASSNARNNCLGRGYACCFILTALAAGIVTGIYMTTGRNYGAWLSSAPPPNINSATDDNNREIPPPQTRRPTLSPTYFRTFSPTARPTTGSPTEVVSESPSSAPTNSSELESLSSDDGSDGGGGRGDGSDDGRGTSDTSSDGGSGNDGNDIFVTPEKLILPAATRPKCKGRTNILHFVSFLSKLSTTTEVGALSTVINEGAVRLHVFKTSAFGEPVCPDGGAPASEVFCGRGPDRSDCGDGEFCYVDPTDRFAVCCSGDEPEGGGGDDVIAGKSILLSIDWARGMADGGLYVCVERKTCYSGSLVVMDDAAVSSLLEGMYLGWSVREVPPGTASGDEIDAATARPVASGMLLGSDDRAAVDDGGEGYEYERCTFQLPLPNPDAPALPSCPNICTDGAVSSYEPPPPPPEKCMAKETLHEIVILDAETNERVTADSSNAAEAAQSLVGMTLVVTAQAKRRVNTIAEVELSSVVAVTAGDDGNTGGNDRYICLKDDRCYGAALTMDGGGNSDAARLVWQLKKVEDASGTATATGGEKKKKRKKKNAAATALPAGVVAEGTLDLLNGALEACDFALPRPGGKKNGGNGNKRKNNKGGGNGGGNKGNGTGNKKKRGNKKKNNDNQGGSNNNSTEGPERRDNATDANNATDAEGGNNSTSASSTTLRTCWYTSDPAAGAAFSLPIDDDTRPFVCGSHCEDCAAPDALALCTDEQRADGTKVSVNYALPESSLAQYETQYADRGFQSCDTDDCNKADACTGSTDDRGGGEGGGGNIDDTNSTPLRRCWTSDPPTGVGYSSPLDDDDGPYVCASFCYDCSNGGGGFDFCSDWQVDEGWNVSVNVALPEESVNFFENFWADDVRGGFRTCDTDDCNRANACTGAADAWGGYDIYNSSLRCWTSVAASGIGFSLPVPLDNDTSYVCTSFCWDCADSTANDTKGCTEEQMEEGTNVSVNYAVPQSALGDSESAYADYGFRYCDDANDCNKANACTGSTDDWAESSGGRRGLLAPGGRGPPRRGGVAAASNLDRVDEEKGHHNDNSRLPHVGDGGGDDDDARSLQKGGGKKNGGGGKKRNGGGKKRGNGGGQACATTCTRGTANIASEGKRRRKKKDNVFEKDSRRWRKRRMLLRRG